MKVGQRVILNNYIHLPPGHLKFDRHKKGMLGTIVGVDLDYKNQIRVKFDNCSCLGYCDGFSGVGGIITFVDTTELPAAKTNNVCVCPSFQLTWQGHSVDCPEQRK